MRLEPFLLSDPCGSYSLTGRLCIEALKELRRHRADLIVYYLAFAVEDYCLRHRRAPSHSVPDKLITCIQSKMNVVPAFVRKIARYVILGHGIMCRKYLNISGMRGSQVIEKREFLNTRSAVCRPQVDDGHLAAAVGKMELCPVCAFYCEIRQNLSRLISGWQLLDFCCFCFCAVISRIRYFSFRG